MNLQRFLEVKEVENVREIGVNWAFVAYLFNPVPSGVSGR
jgi:hypothetical protein